ncbi:Rsm22-domain-containing protein [Neolentinus lepideus HHB14362 ss-1]|uniref:Rsm22-domain-containing protein n=1 Tax=Neolentinus lepideus HHB14362 ss-1 TaxID=1314782 RepID=A0A165U385_9AGAM|nr:Rsm22-domain-containing protein [Neolentinus lepideus HHB14362 ss-1]
MLQSRCSESLRVVARWALRAPRAGFASTSSRCSTQLNSPLDLDPSLQALLKDVDMSLMRAKSGTPLVAGSAHPKPIRELEVYSNLEDEDLQWDEDSSEAEGPSHRETRKSPAAHFGSGHIGSMVIPLELQNSINRLIADLDKPMLHQDAKRLFVDAEAGVWSTAYTKKYKSRQQGARHFERDGAAFASVALPAHYSAIYTVFDHVKRRLGPEWKVGRIIDWGAGTGSGLWAAAHCFQSSEQMIDRQLALSSVFNYVGIDKREALVDIGKRLLEDIELGKMNISWQKSFREGDIVERADGGDVVALSAFQLSSLPTPLARKELVKEMWESGANIIVLIDHSTTEGFENIVEAREKILTFGRKELMNPDYERWPAEIKGTHVIAPCPHDGACPLHHPGSTRLVCGFSQRLQRPDFIRKTKHSGVGHEDVGYSYVVMRRGERPPIPETKVGRTGTVGARALEKAALNAEPRKELSLVGEHREQPAVDHADGHATGATTVAEAEGTLEGLQDQLRVEAYNWPRLVFPPLKRSGHVILDVCAPEAKILRMTIPKSQGKQPYYDARKSSWGDIFPHEPKNRPQERYQPTRAKREGGTTPTKGSDIGKGKGKSTNDKYPPGFGQMKKAKKLRLERIREHARELNAMLNDS